MLIHVYPLLNTGGQKCVYEAETGSSSEFIDWSKIYSMPYKCTIETKCHYFQFRFIHRILPTNEFLLKLVFLKIASALFVMKRLKQ